MDARKARRRRGPWAGILVAAVVGLTQLATAAAASHTDLSVAVRASSVRAVDDRRAPSDPPVADPLPIGAGRVRPVVVLFGDSLAWEASDHFAWHLTAAGADVVPRTMGGTAICDFLDQMRRDAIELRPDAVVIEFSGNALTPCIQGPDGPPKGIQLVEAYRSDAEAAIAIFPGARIYLAGAPRAAQSDEWADFRGGSLNALYRDLATRHPNRRYIDAGAAVLDGGRWTRTLPCLEAEPCTGGTDPEGRLVNVVRAPDGGHFCPTSARAHRGVTGACPVWSSGAHRYGSAMAEAVARDIRPSLDGGSRRSR